MGYDPRKVLFCNISPTIWPIVKFNTSIYAISSMTNWMQPWPEGQRSRFRAAILSESEVYPGNIHGHAWYFNQFCIWPYVYCMTLTSNPKGHPYIKLSYMKTYIWIHCTLFYVDLLLSNDILRKFGRFQNSLVAMATRLQLLCYSISIDIPQNINYR